MENSLHVEYAQTGTSSTQNELGMREMQALVYGQRHRQYLLVKAPPASGKSRAMMFVALDKLANQGISKVIVAVPQKNIGRSFRNTALKEHGFFADWNVQDKYNLCSARGSEKKKSKVFHQFLDDASAKILVCTHATLLNALQTTDDDKLNTVFFGIDEFHHGSANEANQLGNLIRRLLTKTKAHILAMTGSYFRGDSVPVMRPEDEEKFQPSVTYTYYQQLNGYKYLKSLGIGYHFFQGKYISAFADILDTTKKTLIHLPHVNSKTAYDNKYDQAYDIIESIGEKIKEPDDTEPYYLIKTPDGRTLKVADLVEDDDVQRARLQTYLQLMNSRDSLDILIALGTAKEGFDWEWCECCLTIGVRSSLTEVVQIIGRCTRDCEGKSHAQFVNLIPSPEAAQDDVSMAVNDMLKAISVSLLMEQVMAPKWTFKTKSSDISEEGDIIPENVKLGNHVIEVIGLSEPSERVQAILDNDLADLQATVYSPDIIGSTFAAGSFPEEFSNITLPKLMEEKYPYLTQEEQQQLCQHILMPMVIGVPEFSEDDSGNKLIKLAGKFINLDSLSINLIESVQPFQRAYEILSKSLTPQLLAKVLGALENNKKQMTDKEAILLFKYHLPKWKEQHGNKLPSIDEPDEKGRRIALAIQHLRKLKRERMS